LLRCVVSPLRCSLRSLGACPRALSHFFLFTGPAPPDIYTLTLHDALPISRVAHAGLPAHHRLSRRVPRDRRIPPPVECVITAGRSEEHTSELQSRRDLVCRLLLEKKTRTDAERTVLRVTSIARKV